jgi:hypothetical protein
MSKQKSLFELLKPEAKRNLVRNKIKFPATANGLISILKKVNIISYLTVSDVSALHRFTGTKIPNNPTNYLYCTEIFEPYEK